MRPYPLALIVIALLSPALAGCGSSPTRLYVLSADTTNSDPAATAGIAIGVGPVSLPRYLDRPQIVTGTASNSLNQADLDQWGGDLTDNITRVLATNLANLLGTDRVWLYPWDNANPIEYQVTANVVKFDQGADGSTVLDVFWTLVNPRDGRILLMRHGTYRQSGTAATGASGAGAYNALAAAMSRDLAAFSRDIATAIQQQRTS